MKHWFSLLCKFLILTFPQLDFENHLKLQGKHFNVTTFSSDKYLTISMINVFFSCQAQWITLHILKMSFEKIKRSCFSQCINCVRFKCSVNGLFRRIIEFLQHPNCCNRNNFWVQTFIFGFLISNLWHLWNTRIDRMTNTS